MYKCARRTQYETYTVVCAWHSLAVSKCSPLGKSCFIPVLTWYRVQFYVEELDKVASKWTSYIGPT